MLNLGIIGCGVISQYHLRAIAKLATARAAAVCDLREDAAARTAEAFGIERRTSNAAELFADPAIDAVILALPTAGRAELAIEAFRHGKHVLIEKPVAMNAAEVRAMLAVQGDRIGAVCSSRFRSLPSATAAREYIRSGALGSLRTLTCRAISPVNPEPPAHPPVWRLRRELNGGGILVNWGSYDLDYLFGLLDFNLTPQHTLARTWPIPAGFSRYAAEHSDAETHLAALVTFAEGCVLNYERAEYSSLPPGNLWVIAGDRASITLDMLGGPKTRLIVTEPAPAGGTQTRVLWEGDQVPGSEHDGPAHDFVAAILENRAPRTSLQDALLAARIVDAVYASADSGQPAAVA